MPTMKSFCALVILALVHNACSGEEPDDTSITDDDKTDTGESLLPVIQSFSASSASLPIAGGVIQLTWVIDNATAVELDNDIGDVTGRTTIDVDVRTSKTFTLSARNAAGLVTGSTTITVAVPTAPPVINAFTVTNDSLPKAGGTVRLAWEVDGATALFIDGGVGDVTLGTGVDVHVAVTTTFTLTATNDIGTTTAVLTVSVYVPTTPPIINSFSANPALLGAGGGIVSLAWNTRDAVTFSVAPGIGPIYGNGTTVQVYTTTTFTLTATNELGSTMATLAVTVSP